MIFCIPLMCAGKNALLRTSSLLLVTPREQRGVTFFFSAAPMFHVKRDSCKGISLVNFVSRETKSRVQKNRKTG